MSTNVDTAHALRAWAKGMYPTEAATELLIRAFGGRFARPGNEWIVADEDYGYFILWEAIGRHSGPLSGGERRLLSIVASIGGSEPVDLGDAVSGLGRDVMGLVMAAISHANGSHEHTEFLATVLPDGTREIGPDSPRLQPGPLYPWPDES